ncbi:MAG: MEDS domain-containing protein [Pseudonocardiaceae bacterium]
MTETARGFGLHDHLCWAYDEPDELYSRVLEFLGDGLAQGQRVCYFADSHTAPMWDGLRALGETNGAPRTGAVRIESLSDRYESGVMVDPVGQVLRFASAVADALAAGFTGLRVAADATPLVRTPEQLDAFARYEYLVDRYITSQPQCGLCAYNRAELGQETIAQLACMHPTVSSDTVPFRLHASASSAAATLSGELDSSVRDVFTTALRRADLRSTGGELVIDATELEFIDHRNLLALASHARGCAATAVLRTGLTNNAARMIEVLDLKDVRTEVPS